MPAQVARPGWQVARQGGSFYAGRCGKHQAAEPSQSHRSLLYVLYVLYGKLLNIHSAPGPCYTCFLCLWPLQGKPLNIDSSRIPCYMCYMCYMALYSTYTTDFCAE